MTDLLDLFRRVKVAEIAADVVTMRTLFTADATMYEPYSGTRSGPDVAEFLGTACGTQFADLEVEERGVILGEGAAAIEWAEKLTTLDGKLLNLEGCTVVEGREGRLTRWIEYIQPLKRRP
jgi:hypothetical protein